MRKKIIIPLLALKEGYKLSLTKGSYNLCFVGGLAFKVNGKNRFRVVNDETSKEQDIIENRFKLREHIGLKKVIRYASFDIYEDGNYTFCHDDIDSIELKKSRLFIMDLLTANNVPQEEIEILIRTKH